MGPRKQQRFTDPSSHGGVIASGSSDTIVNKLLLARITDTHICPFHGVNMIVSGSSVTKTNKLSNARILDSCMCGAVLINGSNDTFTTK
jgi:uncharacterized Zn-binding protein involved in type VI secretion